PASVRKTAAIPLSHPPRPPDPRRRSASFFRPASSLRQSPFSWANQLQQAFTEFLYMRLSALSSDKSTGEAITLSNDSGISAFQYFSVFLTASLHLEG